MARPAVFLDRDGVIDDPVVDPALGGPPESPYSPDGVRLAEGAVPGLHALRDQGYVLVGVSNQPAAAKGTTSLAALEAVHARVVELLADQGADLDAWYYCHHHPQGTVPELTTVCDCRKPGDGMLRRAIRELDLDAVRSWMVGDSDSDVQAGEAAGVRTVLVRHPGSAHRRTGRLRPTQHARTLLDAATAIGRIGR